MKLGPWSGSGRIQSSLLHVLPRGPWAEGKAGGCPRRGMMQSGVAVTGLEWSGALDLGPGMDVAPDQWFLLRGDFVPLGALDSVWRHFCLSQLGRMRCWHLVGRGQGCC